MDTCTKEHPNKEAQYHPDAECIKEDFGRGSGVADGDFELLKCPHCGIQFWVELPN